MRATRVAAAADAAHALTRSADGLDGAYDVLVTDVVMPGGSGLDLADDELAGRDGSRPLLLISGFNAETVDRRSSMPAGSAFLEKPFELGRAARDRAVAARRYPLTTTKIAKTTPAATTSTPESARAA